MKKITVIKLFKEEIIFNLIEFDENSINIIDEIKIKIKKNFDSLISYTGKIKKNFKSIQSDIEQSNNNSDAENTVNFGDEINDVKSKLKKIYTHSKKIILILTEVYSFNKSFPDALENKIENAISNIDSDVIIPAEKREISFIKLNSAKNLINCYVSIFDKDELNQIKLFLFKNKFKLLSIIDLNTAFYFYCKNKFKIATVENEIIHYYNDLSSFYYLLISQDNILLDSITVSNIQDNVDAIISFIKKTYNLENLNLTVSNITNVSDKELFYKGAILSFTKYNFTGFLKLKNFKNISISPKIIKKFFFSGIILLIINLIVLLINFYILNRNIIRLQNKIETSFRTNYPEITRLVKVDAQSINYNNRLSENIEFLKTYLVKDKKVLYKLRMVSISLLNFKNDLSISLMNFSGNIVELSGKCSNVKILNSAVEELKKNSIINEVNITKSEYDLSKTENIEFIMTIKF